MKAQWAFRIARLCFGLVTTVVSGAAVSASVDASAFAKLSVQAKQDGLVPVVIHLAPTTLDQLRKDFPGIRATMALKAAKIRAELGQEASDAGYWENGAGQIGLHVTPNGLKMLQNSGNAIAFMADQPWINRTHLVDSDGALAEIERRLRVDGSVDLVVTPNVEGLDFDIDTAGTIKFQATQAVVGDFASRANAVLQTLSTSNANNRTAAIQSVSAMVGGGAQASFTPQFVLTKVNREGLVKLAANRDVRKLAPFGYVDSRVTTIDTEALDSAAKNGAARVIVVVRTPLFAGALSSKSWTSQVGSHERTLKDVLSRAGVSSRLQYFSEFGAAAGSLTLAELQRLKQSGDSRLLTVNLSKPVASLALENTTQFMNMPMEWQLGNNGAGQTIAVIDSGVQKTNPFLTATGAAGGASRVVIEACFGSDYTGVVSGCPSKDSLGDSPPGTIGSGEPPYGYNCSSSKESCQHGTAVAGILVGRDPNYVASSGLTARQGVAYGANLISIQAASYDSAFSGAPLFIPDDLLKALQLLVGLMPSSPTYLPYEVNMSIGSNFGGTTWQVPCDAAFFSNYGPFVNAVAALYARGIPVVAAAGNTYTSGYSFPACLPKTIKVVAMQNDGAGNQMESYSSAPANGTFSGEIFFGASGGSTSGLDRMVSTSGFTASMGFQWLPFNGTSAATPHVTGAYAAVKAAAPSFSLPDTTFWLVFNAVQNYTHVYLPPDQTTWTTVPVIRFR